MKCKVCDNELVQENYTKKQWQYKKDCMRINGYVYCSGTCSHVIMQKVRSETMSKTNKMYASERMKYNNPTFKAEVRAKISVKRKGHAPSQRFGNGSGLTEPQKKMMEALTTHKPIAEYAIATNKPRGSEYPQNYKVDVALPQFMVAIEIDGASHHLHLRKEEDKKKDELLKSLGWKVIRFWNKDVNENLPSCIESVNKVVMI